MTNAQTQTVPGKRTRGAGLTRGNPRVRNVIVDNGMPICPRCKSNDQVIALSPPRDEETRTFGIVHRCTYEWWHWSEAPVKSDRARSTAPRRVLDNRLFGSCRQESFSWKGGRLAA